MFNTELFIFPTQSIYVRHTNISIKNNHPVQLSRTDLSNRGTGIFKIFWLIFVDSNELYIYVLYTNVLKVDLSL